MILPPPKLSDLTAGTQLNAGLGVSTVLADFDFETYSPAGYVWDHENNRWGCLPGAKDKGLFATGAARYTEDPDAEVLSLAYDLKDGHGKQLWTPGQPNPTRLFEHLANGGLIEAWNVAFECWVWFNICVPKYGWPMFPVEQLRCAMAKSRAHALPGGLAPAGEVLKISAKKDTEGKRLLTKFSMPRNPTKADPRLRIQLYEDPEDAQALFQYNLRDIEAEAECASLTPDLSPTELEFWQCDQAINRRGVQLDITAIQNCIAIIEQAHAKYNAELQQLTGGLVNAASEIARLTAWIETQGIKLTTLAAENLEAALARTDLPPQVRRALEIRSLIGSAAVKKLYAMANQVTRDGRAHDLFMYHSARTGRAAGAGVQPQNLPNSGPAIRLCAQCEKYRATEFDVCPWCNAPDDAAAPREWNIDAVEQALEIINSRSLELVEYVWGDAIATVSGCLRGLFISAPDHDLICSDYSAIEAVVLAALAGEQWRMDVFNTHGKIYEMSAAKITGIPFDEFEKHKASTGQHHPMRKKVGKVAELASGYQGWINAWKQFGADEFFDDDQIRESILAWRKASPAIVEFWGGQERYWKPELYGIEGITVQAVMMPGKEFSYRGITYIVHQDILYCRLLSGRYLTYHKPRLVAAMAPRRGLSLSFEGWNTNPKNGAIGWQRINTYGGRLVENIVQATARDILAHAIVKLEKSGYKVVLHIHDEIVVEVPEHWGSINEFEKIMATLPSWAKDWPIKATGGWRGKRYRKE